MFALAKNEHEAQYTSGVLIEDVALGAATNPADLERNAGVRMTTTRAWPAAVIVALMAPSGAAAQLSVASGISGPSPVPVAFGTATDAELYQEAADVALPRDVSVNLVSPAPGLYEGFASETGRIRAGRTVSCYLVHFAPNVGSGEVISSTGTLQIDTNFMLLGVAAGSDELADTDEVCAPADRTIAYPSDDPDRASFQTVPGDSLTLDRGGTMTLFFEATRMDQLRFLVGPAAPAGDAGVRTPADSGPTAARDARPEAPHEWDYRGSGGCTCRAAGSAAPSWGGGGAASLLLSIALWRRRRSHRDGRGRGGRAGTSLERKQGRALWHAPVSIVRLRGRLPL